MKEIKVLILGVLIGVMIGGCAGIKERFTGSQKKELVQTYIQTGQDYENKGDLVQALKQYKLALTVDPENEEAIEKKDQLEKNMRILAHSHYRKGITLRKKGKYRLARREFLKTLELQPDHQGALKAIQPRKEIPTKKYIIHTIKPGESLSMVAKIYYGDYKKFPIIAEFNNLADATQITVGQKIKVPEIEGVPLLTKTKEIETGKRYIIHTIKPGESLSMVAKTYYGDYKKFPIIAEFNNLADATQITAGQKIKVPEIEDMPFLASKHEIKTQEVKVPDSIPLEEEKEEEAALEEEKPEEPIDEVANYRSLGIEYFNNKEYPDAIVEFNKVLNANPDDQATREYLYKAHFEYGMDLFNNEDYLAAKKNFEASLNYNKNCENCQDYIKKTSEIYTETHYNRGLSYYGNQQLAEAIREWELVFAVDPNYKDVEKDIQKAKTLLERLENIKKSKQ
jgi:tetratricopeptide (TPR) repeat protein